MDKIDIFTLDRHLFIGDDSPTIFVFEPDKAFTTDLESGILTVIEDKKYLDFLGVMDTLGLDRTEDNALILATELLKRRNNGDADLLEFA